MLASIKGQPVNILVNTVSLVPSPQDVFDLLAFHCTGCGNTISQYQGSVAKIYPILEPYDQTPVLVGCRKCGNKYTFQTHNAYKSGLTKVILYAAPTGRSSFFCHRGRTEEPLLLYTHQGVYSMLEEKMVTLPYHSRCSKDKCTELYYFSEIV